MAVSNSTDRFNGIIASKAIKVPVKRATNVNQTLSGDPGTIDGHAWSNGDRILLYGQTNPIENGIWEVNVVSAWSRAPDFDGARDATESTLITAGRSGSLNPIMYILTTDTNPIRIGTDALAFQIYFDPDNPAAAGLQAVTDVGNTTTNAIIINPTVANFPYLTITYAGRIVLENTTADGDINFGNIAPTAFGIDANGITDLFQFTGFDEFRILGTGAPDGAVLVMGERDKALNPLPGPLAAFGTIWIRADTPNVLVFTDDAGTDWVLNAPTPTLQTVTDAGNVTTNDIDLTGSNLILDDAGEVQFGTVAGGEINIRYNAVDNALEVYDASATNTSFRVGPGINNVIVNPEQNANAVVTIGESTTLRGNAQQAILNMYGEDTSVLHLGQVQNTGALWWFNAPTLPIRFDGTDFLMDTVNARIRGATALFTEEKRLFFEASNGAIHAHVGPQSNGDFEIRNFSQDDSLRIQGTLTGGASHTYLEMNPNSTTDLKASAGRDLRLGVGNLFFMVIDNLGTIDFFYAGTTNVARVVNVTSGGYLINQSITGASGTFARALTTFDLASDGEYWYHDYNSFFMGDPTQSRWRLNNADRTLATAIAVDDLTITGRDFAGVLTAIQAGTQIRMSETKDLTRWAVYEATGPAVDNTGWWEIPVTYVAAGAAFSGSAREPYKFTFSNLLSNPVEAGGGGTILSERFAYDSTITSGDPGAGNFRISSPTPSAATAMYINDTGLDGTDVGLYLAQCAIGDIFAFASPDDPTNYNEYKVTSKTDNTGWWTVGINYVGGTNTLPAATTECRFEFRTDAKVDAGAFSGNSADIAIWDKVTDEKWVGTGTAFRVNTNSPAADGRLVLGSMTGSTTINPFIKIEQGNSDNTVIFAQRLNNTQGYYQKANLNSTVDYRFGYRTASADTDIVRLTPDDEFNIMAGGTLIFTERAAARAPTAAEGELWVRNDAPNVLIYTDDAGTDWNLLNPGGAAQTITAGWSTGGGGSLTIAANAPLFYTEQAADDSPAAGQGQVWVRNDTPNTLMFTDDAGTDFELAGGGVVASRDLETFNYTYDSNTATADPGAGKIRFNNAAGPSSSNRFMISGTDADGTDINALLDDYWNGHWGIEFRMVKADNPNIYVIGAINSTSDQGVWHNPYINWVETNGSFINGDAVKVQITNRAYVHKPTTDHGIYIGSATLSTQPLNGAIQSALITHDPSLGSARLTFNDGGPVNFDVNGGNTDITGSAIFQIRASNRFELYGSGNILPRLTVTETGITIGHANDSGNGTPTFAIHERTSAAATTAEFGYLWVKSDTPNTLYFTDDAGTDHNLIDVGAAAQTISTGWSTGSGGSLTIAANAPLFYTEQATDDTPAAGQGQVWVRNDTPNTLMFTDDAGTDFVIGGAAAGSIGGSIADNQIAVGAVTANDIEGDANLTWNGTTLALGGAGKQLLLNGPETVPTAPTIGFGGGDTGFYERGADILAVSVGGAEKWNWNGNAFHSFDSLGGGLLNETASATNPTINPRRASTQTGIGAAGANELSLISNSVELMRLVEGAEDYVRAEANLFLPESSAAITDQAAYGQLWVRDTAPNTLMFTDDTGVDYPVAGVAAVQTKVKTAEETRTSTTTFTDDNHLSGFALEAGAYYRFEMLFSYQHYQAPDFKYQFQFSNVPQTESGFYYAQYNPENTLNAEQQFARPVLTSGAVVNATDSFDIIIRIVGFFLANATTGGTLDFQWAQNTSDAQAITARKGSFMKVEKIG